MAQEGKPDDWPRIPISFTPVYRTVHNICIDVISLRTVHQIGRKQVIVYYARVRLVDTRESESRDCKCLLFLIKLILFLKIVQITIKGNNYYIFKNYN